METVINYEKQEKVMAKKWFTLKGKELYDAFTAVADPDDDIEFYFPAQCEAIDNAENS